MKTTKIIALFMLFCLLLASLLIASSPDKQKIGELRLKDRINESCVKATFENNYCDNNLLVTAAINHYRETGQILVFEN